jgi:hypothetical protein
MFTKMWNLVKVFANCVVEGQQLKAEMYAMHRRTTEWT